MKDKIGMDVPDRRGLHVVGKRVPLRDAMTKSTGEALYTVDIKLQGVLVGKVLRSPHPHARIIKIDASKAKGLPGVEAVITFEDVPQKTYNGSLADLKLPPEMGAKVVKDQYILTDKARYVGDSIAAVAAIDEETANKALRLIHVEYEVLPAVFDPLEAMKPEAPRIHDFAENNVGQYLSYAWAKGDVEKGFKEADVALEGTFSTSKQKHCQLELDAALAHIDATGRLTIWSQCQAPHPARRRIAELFDLPEGMVSLVTPPIGGGFGGRSNLNNELICVALAQKTRKPVKIEYTREEDFVVHHSRQPFIQTGKIGIKKDGTITALQTNIMTNGGAYFEASNGTTGLNLNSFMAIYNCENVSGSADIVYTNLPISGGMRGFGNPQAMFVLEQLVDMACEKIGMDPMEFRLRNHKRTGDPSWYAALPIASCALEECIKIGAEKIGWKARRGSKKTGVKRVGLGMALASHPTDVHPLYTGHSSALIKINEDGSAHLTVSAAELGQGVLGTLAQIAAEVLGLQPEDIHIVAGNTDVTLFDAGIYGSRGLYGNGNAVFKAALKARAQLIERAARLLDVSPSDLDMKGGRIYVDDVPEKGVSIAEVAKLAIYNFTGDCQHICGQGSFEPKSISPSYQACFAEVEVDTETGIIRVLKVVAVQDSGRAINPMVVEGQTEGAIVQGIGYALTEDYVVNQKNGVVESDNFTTYKILSTTDVPNIEVLLVEKPDPAGPFGAKGCGEIGSVAIAAAIGNAIYDAAGVRIMELPITPEKILKALKVIH